MVSNTCVEIDLNSDLGIPIRYSIFFKSVIWASQNLKINSSILLTAVARGTESLHKHGAHGLNRIKNEKRGMRSY